MLTLCPTFKNHAGCGEMTEHTRLIISNRVRCDNCGYEHEMADMDINARLKEISVSLENHRGRIIMLLEEEKDLKRKLTPVPQVTPDVWVKSDFELHCYKCNRVTRWVHRGRAECHEGCLPGRAERTVAKRKITGDDLPADIIALLLGGDDIVDQDDATLEVIKATGKEPR